jgi:subtilisin
MDRLPLTPNRDEGKVAQLLQGRVMRMPFFATRRRGGLWFGVAVLCAFSLLPTWLTDRAHGASFQAGAAGAVPYLVALRVEPRVDDVVQDYQLHPAHTYWRKFNGFSAMLDAATAARLKADKRVTAVQPEQDVNTIVILGSQTDPAAVSKEFGLRPTHLFTHALKGFVARMDGDKLAQLEADQPSGADKRMRILSVGLDGAAKHIVTLYRDSDPDAVAKDVGLDPYRVFRCAMKGFATAMTTEALAKLDKDPRVMAVEPDGKIVFCGQTYPPGLVRMNIPSFPIFQYGASGGPLSNIVVAVMDTGIQLDHPDLNVCNNATFVDETNGADWEGHGTQVAGIIGALGNADYDGTNIVGVAPGVCLWSVQIVSPDESAWANFIAAADYIVTNAQSIDVVNASIAGLAGTASAYTAVHEAVLGIVNQGIVFVAAAGNNANDIAGDDLVFGTPDDYLPAALPEVMAVNAMDPNPTNAGGSPDSTYNQIWAPSNYSTIPKVPSYINSPGLGIDVTAPGVNIPSTYLGGGYINTAGYETTGTSFASPHAAGLVADYIAANGRGHSLQDTINIRQAIVNYSQPQTAWPTYPNTENYGGPPPLAYPSEAWVPAPLLSYPVLAAQGLQLSFTSVPGYNYTVFLSPRIGPSAQWSPLGAGVPGSCVDIHGNPGISSVTDPNPDSPSTFYQVERTAP